MKKIKIFTICASVALTTFASCNQAAGNASLKTEVDSVSYVMGTQLANGLPEYLQQLGVLGDTLAVSQSYTARIAEATDVKVKASLEKEKQVKLDSITKANKTNLAEFMKGLKTILSQKDSKSPYAQGQAVGIQISQQMLPGMKGQILGDEAELNIAAFIKGLEQAVEGKALDVAEPQAYLQGVAQKNQEKIAKKQEEDMKKQHGDKLAASTKFLEENKAKEGVVTLPDGLQYKVLTAGTGEKPTAASHVKVHYTGKLIDGTVFDSSVQRGEPASFGVGQVIKGWTEALQLMPVGSKWELYIPYELAYGAQGNASIPPFSTLIFEVELLSIEK